MPVHVRQRVAVDQQYRRPLPADAPDDPAIRIGRLDFETLEAFVHVDSTKSISLGCYNRAFIKDK
ncbi:hypothetical protein D3C83_166640 [compost metagenome]